MTPITKTVTVILFVGLFVISLASEAKTNVKEKFHLIYLVSAVDLKKGSKVYVDPIFFTNGEKIIGFHEYCKKGKKTLGRQQTTENWNVIQNYCANKNFVLDPRSYFITNNHGTIVKIGRIKFTNKLSVLEEPVMMGHSILIHAKSKYKTDSKYLRKDGAPDYFFLMANSEHIQKKIIARGTIKNYEAYSLLKRAKVYGRKMVGSSNTGYFRLLRESYNLKKGSNFYNPIYSDIDGDGKLDLTIGVHSVFKPNSKNHDVDISWYAILYIFGNGENLLGAWPVMNKDGPSKVFHSSINVYARFIRNGYPVMSPLMSINVGKCSYGLRYLFSVAEEDPGTYFLESVSERGTLYNGCSRIILKKLKSPD